MNSLKKFTWKKLALPLALCLFATPSFAPKTLAQDTEELAPGYDLCMEKAFSNADMINCSGKAFEYWNAEMQKNYEEALNIVDQDKLVEMHNLWLQYRSGVVDIYRSPENGTMGNLLAKDFLAVETKKQAKLLQSFLPVDF